jgi:hypothetical protein
MSNRLWMPWSLLFAQMAAKAETPLAFPAAVGALVAGLSQIIPWTPPLRGRFRRWALAPDYVPCWMKGTLANKRRSAPRGSS